MYSFIYQSLFTTIYTTIIRRSRPVVLYREVFFNFCNFKEHVLESCFELQIYNV